MQCLTCGEQIRWTGRLCPFCGASKSPQKWEVIFCVGFTLFLMLFVLYSVADDTRFLGQQLFYYLSPFVVGGTVGVVVPWLFRRWFG
jgi:hypothetical protein